YNLQDIIFLHPVTSNIDEKIIKADVVGLFSFYEGMPNIICEGMAYGKPVLCSNISDMSVILEHNLNQVFDPNKLETVVKGLRYYLKLNKADLLVLGNENLLRSKMLF